MPIKRLESSEAFANLRHNRNAIWPDGRTANQRFVGISKVNCTPKFTFTTADAVMTIGSCFARHIELKLVKEGFELPMQRVFIPREERVSEASNDILNKYTVHAIENEIRWALLGESQPREEIFIRAGDDVWHDPHLAPNTIPASFERVCERRDMVLDAAREIKRTRLVIITLGLAESWFDKQTGLYLNGAPPSESFKIYPDRFCLDVLSYEDIVSSLNRIHDLLSQHGHPDFKILITVSPVPFKASFSGNDAIVANSYSKSVQRAACEAFVEAHSNVGYFPSYEIVTTTDRSLSYEIDNIHVRLNVVSKIMNSVLKFYQPDENGVIETPADFNNIRGVKRNSSIDDLLLLSKNSKISKDYAHCAQIYEYIIRAKKKELSLDQYGEILLDYGVVLLRNTETEEGVEALFKAISILPFNARAHYKLGLGLARLKRRTDAIRYFENAIKLDDSVADYHWRLGKEYKRAGKDSHAARYFKRALDVDPGHAETLKEAAL